MAQYRYPLGTAPLGTHPPATVEVWHSDGYSDPVWEVATDVGAPLGRSLQLQTQGEWNALAFTGAGAWSAMGGAVEFWLQGWIPAVGGGLWLAWSSAPTVAKTALGLTITRTNIIVSRAANGSYSELGSTYAFAGSDPGAGALLNFLCRMEGAGASLRVRGKAWLEGDSVPGAWQVDQTTFEPTWSGTGVYPLVECYTANRVQPTHFSIGTAGDSAPAPLLPPADPEPVSVSDIRRTTVIGWAAAYSHPQGASHAFRRARVRRISTDTLVVAATPVALSGAFYVVSLPEGAEGDGGRPVLDPDLQLEVQDEDAFGLTSAWVPSDPFQTLNLWESREFVTEVDLLIERPEGDGTVMQSYRDFGGQNWIKSWRVTPADVDTPIGSASFSLHRQVGGVSLAPLVTGSALNQNGEVFAPALDWNREVEFRACNLRVDSRVTLASPADYGDESLTVKPLNSDVGAGSVLHFPFAKAMVMEETAAGATTLTVSPLTNDVASGSVAKVSRQPTAADWLAGFHWRGVTDDIDWPRKTGDITVPARDYAGKLADTQMRTETRYGDPDDPPDAFDVMQAYVDAHMGAGQYVLVDATTGARFAVTEWIPKDVKVWEGLQQVALQWGGKSIRQVDGPTESQITVIEPDRAADTAEYRVGPETYLEVNRLSTSGENLRTIVRGRCVDSETGEILVSQLPEEVDVPTDPLVDLYGPLFLQFDEDQASACDTQPELDAMVAAAYADVSSAPFPVEVETKFAPFAAIDVMVEWGENEILWDEPLLAAVFSASHSGDAPGVAVTRWQCTDKPKGHWQEWRRRGVDVAGIGRRPSIFSITLTHDPIGTLNVEVDYNDQVESWRAWDNVGASPVTAGIPDDTFSQGEYRRPNRIASWSVQNGVHYVHVRGYAGDRFAKEEATIAIVGVGPGSGEVPNSAPRTPFLERGAVDGDNQSVVATWLNTNTTDALELEYFIDGVTDPGGLVSQPAATSTDEREYAIGSHVTMHARYTAGPGLEGPWSPLSNEVFLPGSLP